MKLLPYEFFTVECNDPLYVVAQRLANRVETSRWFPVRDHLYLGSVWERGFKVVPVVHYMNSFLPVICGRFEARSSGTTIQPLMAPRCATTSMALLHPVSRAP